MERWRRRRLGLLLRLLLLLPLHCSRQGCGGLAAHVHPRLPAPRLPHQLAFRRLVARRYGSSHALLPRVWHMLRLLQRNSLLLLLLKHCRWRKCRWRPRRRHRRWWQRWRQRWWQRWWQRLCLS